MLNALSLQFMKKVFFLVIVGLLCSFVVPKGYKLVKNIATKNSIFTTDNLGNVLLAGAKGDLRKFNRDGDSLTMQNYRQYGELESMDATNPFEIYLYYKDLNKVLLVDNQLAKRGEFDLENLDLENISAIARAADNGLWVYDLSSNRLKKYSRNQEFVLESVGVNFYSNSIISPYQIIDKQNQIYLCDSVEGVFVFDNFGTFHKRLDIKSSKPIQVVGDYLLYAQDSIYIKYNLKLFKEEKLLLHSGNDFMRWEKDRLYILKEKSLIFLKKKEGLE